MVDNLFTQSNFDRTLITGMPVMANWCKEGFSYCGKATILKLKRKSVTVRIKSVAGGNGNGLVGKTLELPRFSDHTRWSSHNCVQPIK